MQTEENIRKRKASANRVLTILKAALNHAYDEGHVSNREAWGRRLKPFRDVDATRVRYLAIEEATRLINAASPDFRPLVIAALQTGARYGELTRLEVADFNPHSGTVTIRRSKSHKSRHIVLTTEGVQFFQDAVTGKPGNALIFTRANGKPWKASEQARPMRDACRNARITPPLGIHQLRHTYCSHCVMRGVPLVVLARNVGHRDTRMIEKHYGHLAPSFIADAIRAGAPTFGYTSNSNVVTLRQSESATAL